MVTRALALVAALAVVAALSPLAAEAQEAGKVYRVGVLWHAEGYEAEAFLIRPLTAGLRERGYVEGRNIVLLHRFPAEVPERFMSMAKELVGHKVDLIVAVSPPSAVAAKKATETIPVVFTIVGDAVALGLVKDIVRPGGNVTGFTILSPELNAKRLQLLVEIFPESRRVGVLHNSDNPMDDRHLSELEGAARGLGVALRLIDVRSGAEIEAAFQAFAREGIKAVVVAPGPLLFVERVRIAETAAATGIGTSFFTREGPDAGVLISYGVKLPEVARRTADYVAKILKGARPGDLPVVQPTKFELVINLKTARALGLTIPPSLVLRADEVIE